MPVYEYLCVNCGHDFEQFQHFTEDALTVCPVCKQEKLRKVYNSVGIVFKGKGFYANDHRSPSGGHGKNGHAAAETESASADKANSGSSAPATETKAAEPAKNTASPAAE